MTADLPLGPLTYLRTYVLGRSYFFLSYRRTPWASGCFLEKSMPPMTRPASRPPMCMKLSTKGVRPMQTCLELGRGVRARVRAGVRAGVREGVRAGSWGEARAGAGARAWGWGSGRGKGWR